ncbi:MAG: FAD-dependent oxidoreductase [Methanocellales archaeon]|nr:FAD-dependent oxidoreductase [Methanocellales archaeon]MDD3292188.1 FAD-dependent oxidoreductase [Methanocellales archaeon]MDD5235745.1 FAD-dependent oxidoreductase [Methanocellales archaeon]MDD5485810.1 FAD-dependent oxidoreductase [Methanocellales archaeon]
MPGKLIVIGGGIAGTSVASHVRKKAPDMDITIFTKDKYTAYSPCGIPFVLSGKVSSFEELIMHDDQYYKDQCIDIQTNTEVTAIDLSSKSIIANGKQSYYDKLVIATGSLPLIPQIPGTDKKGVYILRCLDDGQKVKEGMNNAKKAVIVGAGHIGLEIATALIKVGIDTTVVEKAPYVLPCMLDPDMASIVQNHLESLGVKVMTGFSLGSINGSDNVEFVTIGKEVVTADLVILCTGTRPNTSLSRPAGIGVGETGGIKVDSTMRVAENVYAAGDCVEVMNYITNRPCLSPRGSSAVMQAKVVAENVCGGSREFGPVIHPTICLVGDLQVGSAGVTSNAAKNAELIPVEGRANGLTRSSYYPDAKKINIKLLFFEKRLIGAQIISEEGAKERIDALSLVIKSGMTAQQMLMAETCYAPPMSAIVDVLTLALEDVIDL